VRVRLWGDTTVSHGCVTPPVRHMHPTVCLRRCGGCAVGEMVMMVVHATLQARASSGNARCAQVCVLVWRLCLRTQTGCFLLYIGLVATQSSICVVRLSIVHIRQWSLSIVHIRQWSLSIMHICC
jgi:hypothetical protein